MTGPASPSTRRRRRAAPLLLAAYLAGGQLAPLAHLARHHDDHTHGPQVRPTSSGRAFRAVTGAPSRGHARQLDLAAALAGHGRLRWPWSRSEADAAPDEVAPSAAHQHAPGTPAHTHAEEASARPAPHRHPPASDPAAPSSGDHAAGSAAHFALAIVDAPPAPVLPLPETSRAEAPAPPRRHPRAVAPRQVLARGPPVLA